MKRILAWPVFMCGFRPFFMLTAISACALVLLWLLLLSSALPALSRWTPPGGSLIWHGFELIFGFGMAATAGFLLTAIPEFTRTAASGRKPVAVLTVLWLAARLAWLPAAWLPQPLAIAVLAALNLAFLLSLAAQLLPPLWQARRLGHFSFAWALLGLGLIESGFFLALARTHDALPWLRLGVGLMMVLVVLAGSRISMSVVNRRVEPVAEAAVQNDAPGYLARPPRRNLAIFCLCAFALCEFTLGISPVSGWTALAAAAAMFNLLNDWHIGRALLYRWALMLYASYALVALGHAAIGLSMLGAPWTPSAGRHLLMVGAMGLAIFVTMNIAGRIHAGWGLERRIWVPLAAALLVAAALLRALMGWPGLSAWWFALLSASALCWCGAFILHLYFNSRILLGARQDGQHGCAGVRPPVAD